MSTILEALKKAEEKRARRGSWRGRGEEAPGPPPGRRRLSLFIASVAAFSLAAVLVLLYRVMSTPSRGENQEGAARIAKPAESGARARGAIATVADDREAAQNGVERKAEREEAARPAFPRLRLSGVFWDPEAPLAIVNGKTVSAGDTVAGAMIIKINQESVQASYEGEVRKLRVR